VLAASLLLSAVACDRSPDGESRQKRATAGQAERVRSVVDDLGREIRIDSVPRRIVSLAPSLTEMLFALDAGSQVSGVTSYCDYPPEARKKTPVGDLVTPDIERIMSLRPDLVLVSVEGNSERTFAALEQLGVRTFVSNPRDVAGVFKSLKDIGALTGRIWRASDLVDSLREEQGRLRRQGVGSDSGLAPPTVLMLLSLQPLMAAGASTFIGEVIGLAGARNAAAGLQGNYPTLNRETLLRMDPDYILYPDDMGIDESQLHRGFPEWKRLGAMRRGSVHRIDADRFMRPGPRVFEAAVELRRLIDSASADSAETKRTPIRRGRKGVL
jgi:iron complex transport system substrate-binding protein